MNLNFDRIKIVVDNFFEKIKSTNGLNLDIPDLFYWSVPEENLTDMTLQPNLQVGSLKDDIDFLNNLIDEKYDAGYLELERLSAIFKYLSSILT